MKLTKLFAVALATILLCSCAPSVNPLYTEQDLVSDPALVGTWKSDNDEETWTFEKSGEKSYKLEHTDEKGQKATFEAHLVKLKDFLFLDLMVDDFDDPSINALGYFSLAPCHLILRVGQVSPKPQFAMLNPDWLGKYLEEHPDELKHRITNKRILITAETKDLQNFMIKHAENKEAFDMKDAITLKATPVEAEATGE